MVSEGESEAVQRRELRGRRRGGEEEGMRGVRQEGGERGGIAGVFLSREGVMSHPHGLILSIFTLLSFLLFARLSGFGFGFNFNRPWLA